ncbi:MAG TPA: FecR family protein [Candidatus Acidoferrum sp.]|nr:FecR family protein [Candidatus Acidoferrum sp.]
MFSSRLPFPSSVVAYLLVLLTVCSAAFASDDAGRDVRLGIVEGDVRVSFGNHTRPDLKKPWQDAVPGEPVSQGFALATGNGRASIEFEDGSTVYLAENSLMLMIDLSSESFSEPTTTVSEMSLVTGTATFHLKPAKGESFFIRTPADRLRVLPPDAFLARVDAYLDATGVTAEGKKGESLTRSGNAPFHFERGQTIFMQRGEVIATSKAKPSLDNTPQSSSADVANCMASMQGLQPPSPGLQLIWEDFCEGARFAPAVYAHETEGALDPPDASIRNSAYLPDFSPAEEWDAWVAQRARQQSVLMTAALRASGLSSPIPGLAELYQHGKFFDCSPYGKCWQPSGVEANQAAAPAQSQAQNPPGTAPSAPNQGFQPQIVQWYEPRYAICGLDEWTFISRVARSPQELDELLRLKDQAERRRSLSLLFTQSDCYQHNYVLHHGRYAQLLTPRVKPVCTDGKKCKHPPFPHVATVRVGGRVGFVPRHPADVKGKPPINLKNGILFLPAKPGDRTQQIAVDSSRKFKFENRETNVPIRESALRSFAVPPPALHGHLMSEATGRPSESRASANLSHGPISFDYRSGSFRMPVSEGGFHSPRSVVVAGISLGRNSSFAGNYTGRPGGSFEHSGGSNGRSSSYSSPGSSYSGSSHTSGSSASTSSSGASHSSGGISASSTSNSASSSASGSSANSSGSSGRPH